jgi:2-keto-4-pentenoate hydratase
MVQTLHDIGEQLHAGQVIMTGALVTPPSLTRRNRVARVEFSHLGSATAIIAG